MTLSLQRPQPILVLGAGTRNSHPYNTVDWSQDMGHPKRKQNFGRCSVLQLEAILRVFQVARDITPSEKEAGAAWGNVTTSAFAPAAPSCPGDLFTMASGYSLLFFIYNLLLCKTPIKGESRTVAKQLLGMCQALCY